MKFTPASQAVAFAIIVFPVPLGPYKSTPFGNRAPMLRNLSGFLRNSIISCNDYLA